MRNALTPSPAKKRLTFWLIDHVGMQHREYALELSKRGFDVQFFATLDALVQETRARRPAVIVVGDEGSDQLVEKAILTLTSMPDILGSRLVMTLSRQHENLKRFAACGAFRDLIPLNLEMSQWLNRFVYATASTNSTIAAPPVQVTMNSIAAVSVPARVVWISRSRLWLECRVRPYRGATLNLTGPLAQALGVEALPLTVEDTRTSGLTYRFSDALIASWRVPDVLRQTTNNLLEELQQIDSGPRCKVFVAVQDGQTRSDILRQLDILQFEVTTALHKMSVVEEPKFFTPHLVFVEDSLCVGENQERFHKMLGNLNPGVPVVIVGNKLRTDDIQNLDPNRKISILPRVTTNLTQLIWKKFLPKTARNFAEHGHDDAIYISSDHLFSVAHASFAARLIKLHPSSAQMSLPFAISQYGMLHIESPLLRKLIGRNPYAKVTQVDAVPNKDASSEFKYTANCTLSDVDRADQKKIAQALVRVVSEQFLGAPSTEGRVPGTMAPLTLEQTTTNVVPLQQNNWQSTTWTVPTPPLATNEKADAGQNAEPKAATPISSYRPISRSRRRKQNKSNAQDLKYAAGFVMFTAAVIALLWGLSNMVSPNWQKSGGQYTNSLKRIAPDKFENPAPNAPSH